MSRLLFLIVLLISCTREYSVETSVNGYDTTLFGTGNESYFLKMPARLVGQKANIKFFVTLYSGLCDSIGRNDDIIQLPFHGLFMKYKGNPVLKNELTLHGSIIVPDTLVYYSTTYYVWNSLPVFRDTIKITINGNQ